VAATHHHIRILATVVALTAGRAAAAELDTVRDTDPDLGKAPPEVVVRSFDPRLKPLWLEALARPEADLQRQAADAIARARRLGMTDLDDTVPPLLALLEATDTHPTVRLAVIRALVALDARPAAPALMAAGRHGADAARLIEPALAAWGHAPMRTVWLARLAAATPAGGPRPPAPPDTPPGPLALAVAAAEAAELPGAEPHLRRLALDPTRPADLRLAAARALAARQTTGLEPAARDLAGAKSAGVLDRLVAATLLHRHTGAAAEDVLAGLAADPEPVVAGAAAGRLLESAPARLAPLAAALAARDDAQLRLIAARSLAGQAPDVAVPGLARLLDDPHRDVRASAREGLVRIAAAPGQAAAVGSTAARVRAGSGPRGKEQAAIVVGAVRHGPAARTLLSLMADPAPRVRIAVAWALRRLADPATAEPIFARVQLLTGSLLTYEPAEVEAGPAGRDLEHLIEALGVLRHRPAGAVLRKYIPPPPPILPEGPESAKPIWAPNLRSAAIWALGHSEAQTAPADLVTAFRKRLGEDAPEVRAMAAVGLGRMTAKAATADLRKVLELEEDDLSVRRACAWALGRITGQPVAAPPYPMETRERRYVGWFLEPLGRAPKK
jgi:HEAT repeat protein